MRVSTVCIAFAPAAIVLAVKFAIDPIWMKEWSLLGCTVIGAGIGAFGAAAARVIEPD